MSLGRLFLLSLIGAGFFLPAAARQTCPMRGQVPMLVSELFFGRDIVGRAPVSDVEWSNFAATTLTRTFPDGFTEFDAEGQWFNAKLGKVVREPTKVVVVAAKFSPDLQSKLDAVRNAYEIAFRQQSVGIVTRTECAAF
jgi:hypothetical protein